MRTNSRYIKIAVILASIIMLISIASINASADTFIDTNASVSISLVHAEGNLPIVGETFRLYKLACVDRLGSLTLLPPFNNYPVDLNAASGSDFKGIAGAFDGYILRDKIAPLSVAVTDSEGRLTFTAEEEMTPGLYLVGEAVHQQGNAQYRSLPFCLMLPMAGTDGELLYNITARPKFSSKTEIGEGESFITRRILKKWVDSDKTESRPEKIDVTLLKDGEIAEIVSLNKANGWSYTWEKLDSKHQWTVVENAPEGYRVNIELNGITFLITNTSEEPPEEDENTTVPEESTTVPEETTRPPEDNPPDTTSPEEGSFTIPGDEPTRKPEEDEKVPNTGQLWWPVPTLIASGLFFIVLGQIKRRGYEDEK